jgi:glycosyltransferase involved in cell wall biosynthesis
VSEQPEKLRRRLLSILSFPDIYTGWLLPAVLAGSRAIRRANAKVIFSSAPCVTNHLVGYCLSKVTGLPWVAHFRDPWAAGFLPGAFTTNLAVSMAQKLESVIVAQAARVVSVTEEHSALLRSTYPQIPAHKFVAIPNGFDGAEWEEFDRQSTSTTPGTNDHSAVFRITYAGKLYLTRNPLPVFRGLRKLIDAGEIPAERVRIDLIGWFGVSEGFNVEDLIAEFGLQDCVNIIGPLKHGETLRRMAESDLLLLLAEDLTMQIPGKTFEYLKAGRPVLALTSKGAVANLINRSRGGWVAEPSDETAIMNAIRECYREWAEGRVSRIPDPGVVASYDRRVTTGEIGKLLDQMVNPAQK